MFNPGEEEEGEVDHSFFDSDCDDGSRDEKEKTPAPRRQQAKQTEKTKGGSSPRTDEIKQHLKPVNSNDRSSTAERKGRGCQSKEEGSSRASSTSSVGYKSEVNSNSSDSEEDLNLQSKMPNEAFMLTEAQKVNYSANESEDDTLPNNHSKGRNKQSPKKLRPRHTRSPSPTSSESTVDADSESSSSCRGNGRSNSDPPTLLRPNRPLLSPRLRRTRAGSGGTQDAPVGHTEESEDTVTDVSPLSSPDTSPLHSLDLNHKEVDEGSLKVKQQLESVPSSGLSDNQQDRDSDQDVDEYSLRSESELGGRLVLCCPGGRNRKNYSFTNDAVSRIDRENQRLLRELSRHSPASRPGSTVRKKTQNSAHPRPNHSALNRQREQQRIERENLAFLKRLESVKATPGLKRSEQLKDYQRHVGYMRAPLYPVCMSTTKKDRSTAGSRSASSAQQSSRAVTSSSSTDSSRTPEPRTKTLSAAKPAWC